MAELGARYGIDWVSGSSFGVAVGGLDEFVTRQDWDAIWAEVVQPRQEFLRRFAGQQPQGRHGHDVARMRRWTPLYREIVIGGGTIEAALLRLSEKGYSDPEPDLSTLRAVTNDLNGLLAPQR